MKFEIVGEITQIETIAAGNSIRVSKTEARASAMAHYTGLIVSLLLTRRLLL